ncbi:hypothetical protein CBR_g3552 [Chara braunii]|uniref:Cyanobacterial aminoacyl-tRNA synthetase CAAD domain-containing protein n=1 Tax=Chara braunii TaxID=69332 RepID=A0A388KFN0_CHABU|nr:hypothetical protein CBR_g3552 [Chara braunii]|eukprot:GBG68858.1 hypothetical protein CBR_g3552 [Chara braunii]
MALTACAFASAPTAAKAAVSLGAAGSAAALQTPQNRAVASASLPFVVDSRAFSRQPSARFGKAAPFPSAIPRNAESSWKLQRRRVLVRAQADDSSELTDQAEQLLKDLQAKWDAVEDKTSVAVYGGGAIFALWFSSTIIGAINSVPLLPKVMELVGLGYSGWFIYRYLLFKDTRQELVSEIDELKAKITGAYGKDTSTSALDED